MGVCIVSSFTNNVTELPSAHSMQKCRMRVLCLGNDLLTDDSVGSMVAENVIQFEVPDVEVVSTPEAGFHLLDYVLNAERLVVVDTVLTGTSPVGTIYAFRDRDLKVVPGRSPHYVGLYETLVLSRHLGLPVAEEITILAVEAADCSTMGGEMHPAVRAAIPALTRMIWQRMPGGTGKSARRTMRSSR